MVKKRLAWVALATLALLALPVLLWAAGGSQRPSAETNRQAAQPATDAMGAGERLYILGFGSQVAVVDGASGANERTLPLSTFDPAGLTFYTAAHTADSTIVRALDPATGETLREVSIAGRYDLPQFGEIAGGLSPNGQWLALQNLPSQPLPRSASARSRFVVLDTAFRQVPHPVALDGLFEFDALSDDGKSLYLIESLEVEPQSGSYRVRLYDVAQGRLDPTIIADKRTRESVMAGQRLAAVASPDGKWLYSLYLNMAGRPYLHVLNLDQRYAVCIDFPAAATRSSQDPRLWSLTLSQDGHSLYAAHGTLGLIVEVDTQQLQVRRMAELALPNSSTGGLLSRLAHWLAPVALAKAPFVNPGVLSADGSSLFLLADAGVLAVDTADLSLRDYYLAGRALNSLALSQDGTLLHALGIEPNQIVTLDPATGQILGEMHSTSLWLGLLGTQTVGCPVTSPSADHPTDTDVFGAGPGAEWYCSFDGELCAVKNGSWRPGDIKVGWRKPAGANLEVSGRRLDGQSPPLESVVPDGYGGTFQASGLTFPREGCWEVEAQAADSVLRFVVNVSPAQAAVAPATATPQPPAEGSIYVLDTANGDLLTRLWIVDPEGRGNLQQLRARYTPDVAFSPDGQRMYVADSYQTQVIRGDWHDVLSVYNPRSGDLLHAEIDLPGRLLYKVFPAGAGQRNLFLSDGGRLLFVRMYGDPNPQQLRLWVLDTEAFDVVAGCANCAGDEVWPLPDGRLVCVSSASVELVEPLTGKVAYTRALQLDDLVATALSPGGNHLYLVERDGRVTSFDMTTDPPHTVANRVPLNLPPAAEVRYGLLVVAPGGSRLYVGLGTGEELGRGLAAEVWAVDTETWTRLGILKPSSPAFHLALSADGKQLYSVNPYERNLAVLSTDTFEQVGVVSDVGDTPAFIVVPPPRSSPGRQ